MPFESILKFSEFNELHAAARGGIESKYPDVQIFRFKDLNKNTMRQMGLFRSLFYGIGLIKHPDFTMSVFDREYATGNGFAVALIKPGQLVQFSFHQDIEGFCVLFKESYLKIQHDNPNAFRKFSVLDPTKQSVFQLNEDQYQELSGLYEKMLYEYEKPLLTPSSIIELYIHILFYRVDEICNSPHVTLPSGARKSTINFEFKRLVSEKLRDTKTVSDYAEMLNVTPKYLIEAVTEHSQVGPKDFIIERILSETKTLLRYTDQSIHDIAKAYKFKDQGHFTNFFRSNTSLTPLEYRNNHH